MIHARNFLLGYAVTALALLAIFAAIDLLNG